MSRSTAHTDFTTKTFRRTGLLACSSVFLLFLLGGLVRVTGSGMGCPDWPKCFGYFSPPTCACQLPPDYQEIFLQKRIAKVKRFTALLDKMGMHAKAERIRNDKMVFQPEEFNVAKAWIEYINRIFGVIAGLLSLFFAFLAFRYRKTKGVLSFALLGLLMLIFNAWLGSIVVATNLFPGLVTLHFLLSFLCIFFILLSVHKYHPFVYPAGSLVMRRGMGILFALVMIEVVLGTFARESVEFLQHKNALKGSHGMLDYLAMGMDFTLHRFLPGLIFLLAGIFYFRNRTRSFRRPFLILAGISLLQICFGAFNIVLVLPPWSQVTHIVIGSFLPVYTFYYTIVSIPKD